jgi:hypothetical protein
MLALLLLLVLLNLSPAASCIWGTQRLQHLKLLATNATAAAACDVEPVVIFIFVMLCDDMLCYVTRSHLQPLVLWACRGAVQHFEAAGSLEAHRELNCQPAAVGAVHLGAALLHRRDGCMHDGAMQQKIGSMKACNIIAYASWQQWLQGDAAAAREECLPGGMIVCKNSIHHGKSTSNIRKKSAVKLGGSRSTTTQPWTMRV